MGRAVGIYQQGRAECSDRQGQKGMRVDLSKIRLITGERLPNITKDRLQLELMGTKGGAC